ncbi:hypothetical protein [Kineosporia sp. A_224]|uniref:hypothetical protein n=1 Tax=Kineosporia sp. A_224 TaxID=1962180 RepID=UPI000B4BDC9C|nr:hypothetical protein [Kineosporia sp. A_224]
MNQAPPQGREIKKLLDQGLARTGLLRLGRSRWITDTQELRWIVEADRGPWSAWDLVVGAVVLAWREQADLGELHASDGHFVVSASQLGAIAPPEAASSRFNSRESYFAMVLDGRHALCTIEERRFALNWLADDVAAVVNRVSTLADLTALVSTPLAASGAITARLRRLATPAASPGATSSRAVATERDLPA